MSTTEPTTDPSRSTYTLTVRELQALLGVPIKNLRKELADLGQESSALRSAVPASRVRGVLAARGFEFPFRVVGVGNLRGGIGKTTCTITVGSRAAQYGFKTCILDMDAQGSASLAFGKAPEEDDLIFYDVWQKPGETVMSAVQRIDEGLYLLPSELENGLLDVSLLNPATQKKAVKGVCEVLRQEGFDLVIIDCPPSLGAAVISTVCAADTLVVPLWSDSFSFKGINLTLQEVDAICDAFGLEPPQIKLFYSRHDKREKLAARALERLRGEYAEYFVPAVVGTSTEFSRALARRETIFAHHRSTPAKAAYDAFTRSLLGLEGLGT